MDAAIHAIYVHEKLKGPSVPENPLARLIDGSKQEAPFQISRAAAIARMRTARVVALRRHFARQNLSA